MLQDEDREYYMSRGNFDTKLSTDLAIPKR